MPRLKSKMSRVSLIFAMLLSTLGACSPVQTEPQLRTLNEQNIIDILVGSCIQSTRNCDPSQSIIDVKAALAAGKEFKTISTESVPDDGMVVAIQGIGGGGAWQHVIDRTTE